MAGPGDEDAAGAGAPKPGDGEGASKPGDGAGVPKRGEGAGVPKRGEGAGAAQPGDGARASKPSDGAGTPTPGEGAGTPTPGDGAGTPTPGDGAGAAQPVGSAGALKPGDGAGAALPGDGAGAAQPGDGAGAAQPGDGARTPPLPPPTPPAAGDEALEAVLAHAGEMGRYQWFMFAIMSPFAFFFAFVFFGQMFLTPTPQVHWCHVPELVGLAPHLRRNLTAPRDPATGAPHRCRMFVADYAAVRDARAPPPPGTRTQPCQHGWDFLYEDIPYPTVTSERGWVCARAGFAPTAQALFFVGAFMGGVLFGFIADMYGRIPALVGANMMAFLGGVVTVHTTQFWDFCLARVMVGMGHDNCFFLLYILVLEYVGPRHRTFVANVSMAIFFGGGCIALPWVARALADWRAFVWVSSAPLLGVLLLPVTMPESARWLTARGKMDRAIKVLNRVAWVNKKKVPPEVMNNFIAQFAAARGTEGARALFRSALLRRMLALMVSCFMSVMLVFDCIVRLSENLGLDFFLTFSLSSTTEIPSTLLLAYLLDRGGRRALTCVPLFVTALLMFIAMFVPKGIAQTSLALAARFSVSMSVSGVTQWATEVLPTGVRGAGSAGVHVSGYLASILSPFIVFSERLWFGLPFLAITLLALCGTLAGLLLPETARLPLPQTMADGENLVREHSYYGKIGIKIKELKDYLLGRFRGSRERPATVGSSAGDAGAGADAAAGAAAGENPTESHKNKKDQL